MGMYGETITTSSCSMGLPLTSLLTFADSAMPLEEDINYLSDEEFDVLRKVEIYNAYGQVRNPLNSVPTQEDLRYLWIISGRYPLYLKFIYEDFVETKVFVPTHF